MRVITSLLLVGLLLALLVTWRRMSTCNVTGNRTEYRKGLIAKYGESIVEAIEGPHEKIKASVDYYRAIELKYKQKVKELIE